MRWSARYRGARPCRHRYIVTPSVYSILSGTSRQWSSSCNTVFETTIQFSSVTDNSNSAVAFMQSEMVSGDIAYTALQWSVWCSYICIFQWKPCKKWRPYRRFTSLSSLSVSAYIAWRRHSVNFGEQDIFARKNVWKINRMPEFYMMIARKNIFFSEFGGMGTWPPALPSPPMDAVDRSQDPADLGYKSSSANGLGLFLPSIRTQKDSRTS